MVLTLTSSLVATMLGDFDVDHVVVDELSGGFLTGGERINF